MARHLDRRTMLGRAVAGASLFLLGGCGDLSRKPSFMDFLDSAEAVTRRTQRLLLSSNAVAREFTEAEISSQFRANGTTAPDSAEYDALAKKRFAEWRLKVDGLVNSPGELGLEDLRKHPSRTQITRHDCVEGWSCIGKWKGVQLGTLLRSVGLRNDARYIVFYCADSLEPTLDGSGQYYESIDLDDAFHPQTILAYDMNDEPLDVPHGAPLRLRVERQLGYKMAKYLMRIEAVESLAGIGRGRGGYWEDRGYEWYAGI